MVANIYLPNVNQIPSALQYLKMLAGFMKGKLILGGNLNTPLDPLNNSSTSQSLISFPKLWTLKCAIHNLHPIDVWRVMYPTSRNYTHFSHAHQSYSCIDYFLTDHSCLDWSPECEIDSMAWSDHSPIYLTFLLLSIPIRNGHGV